jgi:hypothetical protein
MHLKIALATAALLTVGLSASSRVKVRSGDLSALKGVTEFNVRYDYSNMTVTTKNKHEQDFIQDKKEDLNKKEAGKGDKWAADWVTDRQNRFEPQFKEEFEKQSELKLVQNPSAKYTMIVHTMHTETGFNIGIQRRNAYIDGEVTIVETANPSNVVAVISADNMPGRDVFGYDFDTGERLKESYAKMGKEVGKLIAKKL